MSDTFYLSLVLISIFFTVKSLKTGKFSYFFLSALFSGLAFLERQFGVALMLSQFLVYLISFYSKKKFLPREIGVFIGTCLVFVVPYIYWIKSGDNVTVAQRLYIQESFEYLKTYIIPKRFVLFRISNDIYNEAIFRIGRYANLIFGLSSFVLLFFSSRLREIRFNKKSMTSFALGIVIMLFLYYRVFLRIKYFDWENLLVFDAPKILGARLANYLPIWKKLFNVSVFASFLPWAYVVGGSITSFFDRFFERRKLNIRAFVIISIIFSIFPLGIIFSAFISQGAAIFEYLFMIYVFWAAGLITIYILFSFKFNKKMDGNLIPLTIIFLTIFGGLQLIMTVFGFFSWEEYVIPFIPLLLMCLSLFFSEKMFNLKFSLILLIPLLFFSLVNTKGDYEQNGIFWETAEEKINQGLLEPTEAGLINWAWFPYFYFEESFDKKVKEVGGDKANVRELHTWWSDPNYNYKKSRLLFISEGCKNVDFSDGSISLGEISTKSIFFRSNYCLKYYPKEI